MRTLLSFLLISSVAFDHGNHGGRGHEADDKAMPIVPPPATANDGAQRAQAASGLANKAASDSAEGVEDGEDEIKSLQADIKNLEEQKNKATKPENKKAIQDKIDAEIVAISVAQAKKLGSAV
ncbi:hypothetical protein K2X33_10755 [bacterium]|nr:hypothetical protein [bacterium]